MSELPDNATGETSDVDANPAAKIAPARIAHIVLAESFVEHHGPEHVQAYVDAVVAAQVDAQTMDEDAVATRIRERLDAVGLAIPDESYRNLAKQVHDSTGVAISTDGGEVLHGDPAVAADVHEPDVRGADDPDDPDRPFYS